MLSQLLNNISTWTFEGITFGIFVIVFVILIFKLHRSKQSKFLIDSLFVDDIGRASTSKLGEFIALVVSTWVVVHLSISKELTYEILTVYMAAWVANRGFRHYINSKYHKGVDSEPEEEYTEPMPETEEPEQPKRKSRTLLN